MKQVKLLTLKEDVLGASKKKAAQNKKELGSRCILAVNVMSSPGAGKTSLILQTISRLSPRYRIAVIEGDVASVVDADKVSRSGIPVVQINIPGGCHLDAAMVENALANLPLGDLDLIIIENVGNLICPAEFDLGEQRRVLLSSAPEGDDKPHKYPLIFSDVDLVMVNKIDLLPYVDFNLDAFSTVVHGLNPRVQIIPLSCKTGEGLDNWCLWLEDEIGRVRAT